MKSRSSLIGTPGLMCEEYFGRDWSSCAVMHGEDDQVVPIKDSAKKSARLIKGAQEIYYPGRPQGLTAMQQDEVNTDLLKFLRSVQQARKAA